jgi:D-alanyl-lipoteichoic acid acyltransferase DltB (MBOAT superfamily)
MLFPTMTFAVFFFAVFFAAWALRGRPETRKWVLVAASYLFYAGWDWRFCFLLLASSVLNYAAARGVAASQGTARRRWVAGAVTLNLSLLGVFKYYNFFVEQFDSLMSGLGVGHTVPFINVVLPVAISFFTFHGISYVVDVHRGKVSASRSFADLMLYLSFFPQLVAGPIVRASMFLPQLEHPADPARVPVGRAVLLIVVGLFKKVVVANAVATQVVDPVFLAPAGHGTIEMLFAAWGYAVQI